MGFRTTMKCPQKEKKKVGVVKNSGGLSKILIEQSYPSHNTVIYCTLESRTKPSF